MTPDTRLGRLLVLERAAGRVDREYRAWVREHAVEPEKLDEAMRRLRFVLSYGREPGRER